MQKKNKQKSEPNAKNNPIQIKHLFRAWKNNWTF